MHAVFGLWVVDLHGFLPSVQIVSMRATLDLQSFKFIHSIILIYSNTKKRFFLSKISY